jgi:predicted ATPase
MIRSVHIRNFKCLRDTEVIFREPLTVVVGPNNSGKSCLLEALRTILALGITRLDSLFEGGQTSFFLVRTFGAEGPISFDLNVDAMVEAEPVSFTYELSFSATQPTGWIHVTSERLTQKGKGGEQILLEKVQGADTWQFHDARKGNQDQLSGNPGLQGIMQLFDREAHAGVLLFRSLLGDALFFDLQPRAMKSVAQIVPNPVLATDGGNLAACLDYLKSEHEAAFDLLMRDLRSMVPEVRSLALRAAAGGQKFLAIQESYSPVAVPSLAASDGLLRFLAILAALHDPRWPRFLAFEEPENGLHPRRLEQIVECMRLATQATSTHPQRQVVLATHSPYLLDKVRPEEVLVVTRDEGGTKIGPVADMESVKSLLEDAPLGELWHRGTIGGVPSP